MSNPTAETTYDLNTKELIEAAKGLLDIIEHINKSSMKDVTLAWGRLNKAVITMECQNHPLSCEPVEVEEMELKPV